MMGFGRVVVFLVWNGLRSFCEFIVLLMCWMIMVLFGGVLFMILMVVRFRFIMLVVMVVSLFLWCWSLSFWFFLLLVIIIILVCGVVIVMS